VKPILSVLVDILRAGALLLAVFAAALAVAAQGGRFSNRLDVLTHLTPLALGAAVIALALWLAAGREGRATGLLAAIGLVSALTLMGPELAAAMTRKTVPADAATLRLLQFNVWVENRNPERTAQWILEQDPDIIVFEEASARRGVAKLIAPHYPYRSTCDEPLDCSTMILSKHAPIAEGGLSGPQRSNLMGAWATFPSEAGPYTVVGIHYTWPWPAGPQQLQTKRMVKALKEFDHQRLIVSGDFNSTPWSFSLRRQDKLFGIERRTRALFSWPAGEVTRLRIPALFPILAIDQIYAGPGWKTVTLKRGPELGSDHYPVLIELTPSR
jgi:endonuclease/exonuclease/phosphatase (EEP) superfamily protein YafD